MTAVPAKRGRGGSSQAAKTQVRIRELILSGRLPPGGRVSELSMVEELGVSRTPVRMALTRLRDEGLLDAIPSGGFAVRAFTEREVFEAIEIRGLLEGLAVRLAAERGVTPEALAPVEECLAEIDTIVTRPSLTADGFSQYAELNARFHTLVVGLAGSETVTRQVERASALPFASPGALVLPENPDPGRQQVLVVAQDQHRRVVEAIVQREGGRAEAIMREHSRISSRNLALVSRTHPLLRLLPEDPEASESQD